jgi:hypothetical protein
MFFEWEHMHSPNLSSSMYKYTHKLQPNFRLLNDVTLILNE